MDIKKENEKQKNTEEKVEEEVEDKIVVQEYPIIPKYKKILSYDVTSDQYYDQKYKDAQKAKEMRIEIDLDLLENLKELECDVVDENLVLKYKEIYFLKVPIQECV